MINIINTAMCYMKVVNLVYQTHGLKLQLGMGQKSEVRGGGED